MSQIHADEQDAEAWSEWVRQIEAQMEPIKRAWQEIAEAVKSAWKVIQEAFYGGVPGTPVPEVWEAFGMRLIDESRPAYDPESPEYLDAVDDTAADIVRYLAAVARIREKEAA